MASRDEDLRERLDRVEAQLEKMLTLLEGRGNGHDRSDTPLHLGSAASVGSLEVGGGLATVAEATARATAAHAQVEGAEALTERLAQAALDLTEPDTLRSLTLLAQLAPRIEYAAQAAAAAPALLEDFMHGVRATLDERGAPDPAGSVESATDAVLALTTPENLEALARLGRLAPPLAAVAEAAGEATAARREVEGAQAFQARIHEAVLALTEPETLESLVRVAELTPRLEYAIQAAAAAPALLEDFLHAAREKLESRGVRDPGQGLDAATDAAIALTRPEAIEALGRLGAIAPHLSGLATAAAEATQARAAVEGEAALQARLREAVLELTDPEVLGALVRIAQLTPKLEFAAYAAAAAPALLEDLLHSVREQVPDNQARLDAGLELVQQATSPQVLSGLAQLTAVLPGLASQDTGEALRRLADQLPTLDKAAKVAGWVPAAIEAAAQEAGHEDLEEIEPQLRAAIVLLLKLSEADTLRALIRLADQSPRVAPLLERLAAVTGEINLEGLADVFIAAARPDVQQALARLLELAPTLVPVIEALPVQPRTLEVLKTVNQTVEETAGRPRKVGLFGLLRALGNADLRRSLGLALDVAAGLGRRLPDVGQTPLPPAEGGRRLSS